MACRGRISEPVRANGIRFRIINADAAQRLRGKLQVWQAPAAVNGLVNQRRSTRHHAANGRTLQPYPPSELGNLGQSFPAEPGGRRHVSLLDYAPGVRQPQMRVRVADVEEENHLSSVTSPPMIRSR